MNVLGFFFFLFFLKSFPLPFFLFFIYQSICFEELPVPTSSAFSVSQEPGLSRARRARVFWQTDTPVALVNWIRGGWSSLDIWDIHQRNLSVFDRREGRIDTSTERAAKKPVTADTLPNRLGFRSPCRGKTGGWLATQSYRAKKKEDI